MIPTNSSTPQKHILIAEDEEFIATLYKINLEKNGVTVTITHNGNEALAFLETHRPDLILLDILMPEMDGIGVLKEIQRKGYHIPVIMLTNMSQDFDRVECQKLGALDFIVKSNTDINALWQKIQPYLR